jgi:hypothetical protein
MHEDSHHGVATLIQRSAAQPIEGEAPKADALEQKSVRRNGRDLSPADGSVARMETHVSVFCASCQRWIDCYDGIEPEIVHQRHNTRTHETES